MPAYRNRNRSTAAPGGRRGLVAALIAAIIVVLAMGARILISRETARSAPAVAAPVVTSPATTARDYYSLPAEFESQDLLYVAAEQLAVQHPEVLAAILRGTADEVPVTLIVGSAPGRAAVEAIVATSTAAPTILPLRMETMWLRDFGPFTVTDPQGRRSMVEFRSGHRRCHQVDDDVPPFLAIRQDFAILGNNLQLEGGDVLTNGRGLGVLSNRVVDHNAGFCDSVPACIARTVAAMLGLEQVLLVPPLDGEPTGHLDQACAFIAPDLAVVGRDESGNTSVAAGLDLIAGDLAGMPTPAGPLRVERIPQPSTADGVWRSYTTIMFAGGTVLVPNYPGYCPELDIEAMALYRRLLPGRRIVGIDAEALARAGGDLHSIMVAVPLGGAGRQS